MNSATSKSEKNKARAKLSGNYPHHVAIIMDGNGRWAKKQKLKRQKGHEKGLGPVKLSILECIQLGIEYLSVYVFSTENWNRPKHEVQFIMKTLARGLRDNYDFYRENGIRIMHSGNREKLNKNVLAELDAVIEETKNNRNIVLNVACNYGGKDEIIRGIKKYLQTQTSGSTLNEEEFLHYLDCPEIPNIDLLIRTGGQQRLSNFFLWKIAYAELYFTDVLWPDWSQKDFQAAIKFYMQRKRQFGTLKEL